MKTNIFIPKKIKIGFQNRDDTYTKKLAYVIYYDQKGILRKQKSWESWRDKKINPVEFDNIPTSGFVLNKKVGDYASRWNHRQAYCRVYDERDFEFEITIENLLYILTNTSCIKGKGLEGLFVYGWDGKDLLLMPIDSPDYKEISQYNEIIHAKNYIKSKDLIIGATYRTKQNEEWIYMGRFDYHTTKGEKSYDTNSRYSYDYKWIYTDINKGKHHFFAKESTYSWNNGLDLLTLKSLGDKFIEIISSDCIENYSDLFAKLECTTSYSPLDASKDEYIVYTFEEFTEKFTEGRSLNCFDNNKRKLYIYETYKEPGQYFIEDRNNNNNYLYNNKIMKGILEEIYNNIKPMYKNEYLVNGKLYSEGK